MALLTAAALDQPVLIQVSLAIVMVWGVWLGWRRLVCPECGRRQVVIATEMTFCPHCGAPYFGSGEPIKKPAESAPAERSALH
jgi:hypothetical protein